MAPPLSGSFAEVCGLALAILPQFYYVEQIPPILSGLKQRVYQARGLCGSGICTEHSGDDLSVLCCSCGFSWEDSGAGEGYGRLNHLKAPAWAGMTPSLKSSSQGLGFLTAWWSSAPRTSVLEKVGAELPILTSRVPMAVSESQARPDSEGGHMDPSPPTVDVHEGRMDTAGVISGKCDVDDK